MLERKVRMRGRVTTKGGFKVLDNCYNASEGEGQRHSFISRTASSSACPPGERILYYFLRFYLFIFRERGREEEKGEKH